MTLLIALVMVVSACSGGEPSGQADNPAAVVRGWLDAVGSPDPATAERYVEPTSLALIAAVENGLSPEETVAIVDDGLTDELAAGYWGSFADSFADFAGRPIATLRVGDFEIMDAESYAVVELKSGDAVAEVVTVMTEAGWQVDLVGTLGPGFVRLLLDSFLQLPNTEAANRLVEVYAARVAPVMKIVTDRSPGADFETDARSLLAEIAIRQRAG